MSAFALWLALGLGWAAPSAAAPVEGGATVAAPVDLRCVGLRQLADRLVPAIRRGRVEITACARIAGVRALVVLQSARGVVGDPVEMAGGSDGGKLRPLAEAWKGEPVVFVGDRGDPARMVREALAPLVIQQLVAHPSAGIVDVILAAPLGEQVPIVTLAEQASGYRLRTWTIAGWTAAREDGREELITALAVTEAEAEALVDAGALTASDLAAMAPEAVLRATGGDRVRAQGLIDAAAWWSERQSSLPDHRRGW